MRNVAVAEPDPRLQSPLLKVRERQCRFIVSEDAREAICCGSPTVGASSWCAWHWRIVYVPSPAAEKAKTAA
jgi:hypothetical protein